MSGRPIQYTAKVDAALDAACRDFTKADWIALALAAIDQAGISGRDADRITKILTDYEADTEPTDPEAA